MPGLLFQNVDDSEIRGDEIPSRFGATMSAQASEMFDDLPLLSSIPKAIELDLARTRYAWTQKKYDFDAARAYVEQEQGLPSDWLERKEYNKLELDILSRRKRRELRTGDALSRADDGIATGAARLAVSLGVGMADPLNVLTAFIPVISAERYAAMLARQTTALGRAGVRVGVGAAEGVAGAAAIEPLTYAVAQQEMADYTLNDSFANITFGSIFGATLHAGGGAIGDAMSRARLRQVDAIISRNDGAESPQDAASRQPGAAASDQLPDPFLSRPTTERVQASRELQSELRSLNAESGWDTVGGRMIRATEDSSSAEFGTVVSRTPWLPRAEWWPGRPGAFNETETASIIEKAISGERLGTKQAEYLDYLVEIADSRIALRDFAPTADEMSSIGLKGTQDDSFETALVAKAKEISEDEVENIAKRFEDDDAGFLGAIKEFVDASKPREAVDGSSGLGQAAAVRSASEAVRGLRQTTQDAMAKVSVAQSMQDQPLRLDGLAKLDNDRAGAAAAIRADAEAAAKFENSPLSEMAAVRETDERLAAIKGDELAQATAEADEAERMLADALATIGDGESLPAEFRAELDAAMKFSKDADSMRQAASMIVQCAMRHPV